MKVYIVTEGQYHEGYSITGGFSSKETAEVFVMQEIEQEVARRIKDIGEKDKFGEYKRREDREEITYSNGLDFYNITEVEIQ